MFKSSNHIINYFYFLFILLLILILIFKNIKLQIPATGQFKQMLCVDNGFLCESRGDEKNDPIRWNGELKTTHIVIQNSADESESDPIHVTSAQQNSLCSWSECANMAVLPIRCKNTNAELHKSRFGSGGRGRCIKLGNDFFYFI